MQGGDESGRAFLWCATIGPVLVLIRWTHDENQYFEVDVGTSRLSLVGVEIVRLQLARCQPCIDGGSGGMMSKIISIARGVAITAS